MWDSCELGDAPRSVNITTMHAVQSMTVVEKALLGAPRMLVLMVRN